ncbi:NAD-dependent epimerase/dehydratase family protein [Lysinibacillus sp. LZ02]|uniref:NAD-dependent epimerase/dehydratase family protein n=1 Tax=Lysinibacillus sp. LZ02 TaxID=3420668 RepID=UPI003D36C7AB
MKVLITGENGYISGQLYDYLNSKNNGFQVIKKSVRSNIENIDLNGIETVVHLAGLVHKKKGYPDREYIQVNCELTKNLALSAKKQGVKQFIFFSTMAVYGFQKGEITSFTATNPETVYGKSKLLAEKELERIASEDFKVAIVRPPMVYGPNCPGNYKLLSDFIKVAPIFPYIDNKRSMIFIGNLNVFIEEVMINRDSGVFHIQDPNFVSTTNMVKNIANINNLNIRISKRLGIILSKILKNNKLYLKVFGDLFYSTDLTIYNENTYQKYDFNNSINISEKKVSMYD